MQSLSLPHSRHKHTAQVLAFTWNHPDAMMIRSSLHYTARHQPLHLTASSWWCHIMTGYCCLSAVVTDSSTELLAQTSGRCKCSVLRATMRKAGANLQTLRFKVYGVRWPVIGSRSINLSVYCLLYVSIRPLDKSWLASSCTFCTRKYRKCRNKSQAQT